MSGPLYEGIAADLRGKIADGTYRPGDSLPSENELAQDNGVSRQTARQALNRLRSEGLVTAGRGLGWRVSDMRPLVWYVDKPERNVRTDISPADAWSDDMRAQGVTPTEKRTVSVIQADVFVADRLGLETGELVVARKRVRYVDGAPAMLADTYYPNKLVAGTPIAEPGDVLPGVWAVMEALGHGWDERHRVDDIDSRQATRQEASIFGFSVGYAVTEVVRTRRTAAGMPLAVSVFVVPGGRRMVLRRIGGEEWKQ